jgi:hypothetical protein
MELTEFRDISSLCNMQSDSYNRGVIVYRSQASEWQSIRDESIRASLKKLPHEQGSQHKQFCTMGYSLERLCLLCPSHFLNKTNNRQEKSQHMDFEKPLYELWRMNCNIYAPQHQHEPITTIWKVLLNKRLFDTYWRTIFCKTHLSKPTS